MPASWRGPGLALLALAGLDVGAVGELARLDLDHLADLRGLSRVDRDQAAVVGGDRVAGGLGVEMDDGAGQHRRRRRVAPVVGRRLSRRRWSSPAARSSSRAGAIGGVVTGGAGRANRAGAVPEASPTGRRVAAVVARSARASCGRHSPRRARAPSAAAGAGTWITIGLRRPQAALGPGADRDPDEEPEAERDRRHRRGPAAVDDRQRGPAQRGEPRDRARGRAAPGPRISLPGASSRAASGVGRRVRAQPARRRRPVAPRWRRNARSTGPRRRADAPQDGQATVGVRRRRSRAPARPSSARRRRPAARPRGGRPHRVGNGRESPSRRRGPPRSDWSSA